MNTIDPKVRYYLRMRILELIDRRRAAECDSGIGASIERRILAEECEKLERDSSSECVVSAARNLQK
ncbi:MAG: hypothetical protein ABSH09_27030 [Bryobacteraceae bacterium]